MNYLQLTGFDSIFNLLTSNHWCCQEKLWGRRTGFRSSRSDAATPF